MNSPEGLPWRTGRKVGRTIYTITDWQTLEGDLIGMMDTPELATAAVDAHNQSVAPGMPAGPPRPNPVISEKRPHRRFWRRK